MASPDRTLTALRAEVARSRSVDVILRPGGRVRFACLLLTACSGTVSGPPGDSSGDGDTQPPTTDTAENPTDTATPTVPLDPVTETFPYTAPPADILFVIDASTSMIGNTETLIGALEGLVDTWMARNIDFHVGVIDIDESDVQGELISIGGYKWADPTVPTPGLLLRQMVDAVPDPSTNESGRESAYKALEFTGVGEPNDGFLRPDSDLAIIVHTDESDQSDPSPVSPQEFIDYLIALRPDPDLRGFDAIVATEDYFDITTEVGGVAWSVNNTPYGPALDAITSTIEGHNSFVLAAAADPDSITAHVIEPDGTLVDLANGDLSWNSGTHEVDLGAYYPLTGATVEITYRPLAG
jgi:hypothetical protein